MYDMSIQGTNALCLDAKAMSEKEWLNRRKEFFGASEIACILGISEWGSPFSVWANKMGWDFGEKANDNMNFGKFMEPAISAWFQHDSGLSVLAEQVLAQHPTDLLAGATLDAVVAENATSIPLGAGEWKTEDPFADEWSEVPDYYQCQGQWQLYVTGWPVVYFAVLRGRRLQIIELKRDQADIDYLVEKVHEFHEKYILTQEPPPVYDGKDATIAALGSVYAHTPDKSVEITKELCERLRLAKQKLKESKEEEAQARAAVMAEMKDAEMATVDDIPVFSCKTESNSKFDRERFEADHPGIYETYLTQSTKKVLRDKAARKNKGKK